MGVIDFSLLLVSSVRVHLQFVEIFCSTAIASRPGHQKSQLHEKVHFPYRVYNSSHSIFYCCESTRTYAVDVYKQVWQQRRLDYGLKFPLRDKSPHF